MTTTASSDTAAGHTTDEGPHLTTSPNVAATITSASEAEQKVTSTADSTPSTCKALQYNEAYDAKLQKPIDGYAMIDHHREYSSYPFH